METWVDPTIRFEGKVFTVRAGGILLADGTPAYREVVDHSGGVCVLPYDGNRVTLVRQYRIAVQDYVVEGVAGKLEPGDIPARRAQIELEEEAGLRAERLVSLGEIFGCVGFCSERIHLFVATELTPIGQRLEPEERIELLTPNLADVANLLENNELTDAKTIVLLQRFLYWLRHSGAGI